MRAGGRRREGGERRGESEEAGATRGSGKVSFNGWSHTDTYGLFPPAQEAQGLCVLLRVSGILRLMQHNYGEEHVDLGAGFVPHIQLPACFSLEC